MLQPVMHLVRGHTQMLGDQFMSVRRRPEPALEVIVGLGHVLPGMPSIGLPRRLVSGGMYLDLRGTQRHGGRMQRSAPQMSETSLGIDMVYLRPLAFVFVLVAVHDPVMTRCPETSMEPVGDTSTVRVVLQPPI